MERIQGGRHSSERRCRGSAEQRPDDERGHKRPHCMLKFDAAIRPSSAGRCNVRSRRPYRLPESTYANKAARTCAAFQYNILVAFGTCNKRAVPFAPPAQTLNNGTAPVIRSGDLWLSKRLVQDKCEPHAGLAELQRHILSGLGHIVV
jgi:hypothetical protein